MQFLVISQKQIRISGSSLTFSALGGRGSEGAAEGGCGGNSAAPERIQKADSPAVLLVKSRTPQNSFLFLLEERNRRTQIKNCEENFFAGW